ncbi:hypothetical protein [Streptomyces sp. 4F14]|uniref:hypothetical protein n=1 Tax=Streptomyces sp. 4F14 TaxID=3394380 RepID=UPI003A8B1DBD
MCHHGLEADGSVRIFLAEEAGRDAGFTERFVMFFLVSFWRGGKLPRTWMKTVAQLPMTVGDSTYDPLFPYGFGLTYAGTSR